MPIVGLKVTQWGGPPLSAGPPFSTWGINTMLPSPQSLHNMQHGGENRQHSINLMLSVYSFQQEIQNCYLYRHNSFVVIPTPNIQQTRKCKNKTPISVYLSYAKVKLFLLNYISTNAMTTYGKLKYSSKYS
jgi:hypothetical protein